MSSNARREITLPRGVSCRFLMIFFAFLGAFAPLR
jgi:hypothetical protein